MPKKVIHRFGFDLSELKENDRYSSLCGKVFIACEPPTEAEAEKIKAHWKDKPICKRCACEWKRMKGLS